MGFFRAAFARVFFGVFKALSVIAWSDLHTATATVLRVRHALCPNLTPRFLPQKRRLLLITGTTTAVLACLCSNVYAACPTVNCPYKYGSVDSGVVLDSGYCGGYVSVGGPGKVFTTPQEAAFYEYHKMMASALISRYCNSVAPQYDYSRQGIYTPLMCDFCGNGPQPAHATVDVATGAWGSCPTNIAYNYTTGSTDVVDSNGNCGDRDANLGTPPFCGVGDPINHAVGNKYQIEVDYTGGGGSPLRFERFYNSKDNWGGLTQATMTRPFWRTSYERKLSPLFVASGNVTTVYAKRADGKQLKFDFDGSQWNLSLGSGFRLTAQIDATSSIVGWLLRDENDQVETYDRDGILQEIKDRSGIWQQMTYDTLGRLTKVSDMFGRSLILAYGQYDEWATLKTLTTPDGGIIQYIENPYVGNSSSNSVIFQDGSARKYIYDEPGYGVPGNSNQLTGIVDEKGNRIATFAYDNYARAISYSSVNNIDSVALTFNSDGTRVVTDALGTPRTYSFTTVLGVVKSSGQTQPSGSGCAASASNITYDTNGNAASRTDFNNHKVCYAYDLTRNLETARVEGLLSTDDCATALAASTLSGVARKVTTVWDTTYRLPHLITEAVGKPEERVTTINYDPTSGNVLSQSIKDTASGKTRTWTYSYTTAADNTLVNLLKSVDGPRTDVADITTYTYYTADDTATPIKYRRGDLWKITNALSQTTTITSYDGNGCPLTIIAPNTVTTTLIYWPRGWLKSKTIGSKTTLYNYDNVGNLTKVTLGDGSFIQYTYDAAHRMTDISDILLNRIHYTLDAIGNRVKEEVFDSNSKLSTVKARDFDPLNRLWHDIAYFNDPNTPVATQYSYDANGNLRTATAPANSSTDTTFRTTTLYYDALNRLAGVIDPLNPTAPTKFGYDGLDQVKNVTDPRTFVTSYTVNALGDTTQESSPDSKVTNRVLDEAGNIKSATNARGIQATYQFDALNRLLSVSYPSTGESIAYTWDSATGCTYGIGRLCQITDAGGSVTFAYDDQGNRVKETRLKAGVNYITQYGYDGANRRTSEIPPATGETLVIGRNTSGRTNTLTTTNGTTTTTLAKQTTYDGSGQVASKLLGNGVKQGEGFDLSGLPASVATNKIDGDLNGDGIVNVVDVMFAEQIAMGLRTPTPDQLVHGDVSPPGNPDGKIDVRDVSRIMRKAFGLENF
jgi:YD repeat-containing protein